MSGGPVRVAIHDDFPIVVAGLTGMLAPHADRVLVTHRSVGAPVEEPVDVLLLDTFGQPFEFVDRVQEIVANDRVGHVAVYTWIFEDHLVEVARGLGVSGYLSKATTGEDLVDALVRIAQGAVVVHDPPAPASSRRDRRSDWPGRHLGLTERQAEVLVLAARGLTTAQIALRLRVSVNTVKSHLREAYARTGVRSRADAANYVRSELLDGDLAVVRSPWLAWTDEVADGAGEAVE